MPEYLSPGVYVEEVSSGIKPLEGVGTSTGAFVGVAQRGPIGEPRLITNWTQFKDVFGDFIDDGYLAYAVYQFFNEGGSKCYVIRAAKALSAEDTGGDPVPLAKSFISIPSLRVNANSEGIWGDELAVRIEDESIIPPATSARATHFKLIVKYMDEVVEVFDNITLDSSLAFRDEHIANIESKWVELVDEGETRPTNTPTTPAEELLPLEDRPFQSLADGADGGMLEPHWAGADGFIHNFNSVDEINIVAIPDAEGSANVTRQAFTYCENRKDCFYVADMPMGLDTVAQVVNHVQFTSSFAAIYHPWIIVSHPKTGKPMLTPPSGAIVGTYSHTDIVRGVHKAPAGLDVGYLNSANGVEFEITKGQHDILNPLGINVIRQISGIGPVVWGARTLATKSDPEWKYINVRRLFLFLEETIDEGTQWVVFEPNTQKLWGSVKRNITAFLTGVWRDGALFGATADQAFFVKVDAENNPPDVINSGKLIIEVGVAPVKPAEFVIIRISQKTLVTG